MGDVIASGFAVVNEGRFGGLFDGGLEAMEVELCANVASLHLQTFYSGDFDQVSVCQSGLCWALFLVLFPALRVTLLGLFLLGRVACLTSGIFAYGPSAF